MRPRGEVPLHNPRFAEVEIILMLKAASRLGGEGGCCKHGIGADRYYQSKSEYGELEAASAKEFQDDGG